MLLHWYMFLCACVLAHFCAKQRSEVDCVMLAIYLWPVRKVVVFKDVSLISIYEHALVLIPGFCNMDGYYRTLSRYSGLKRS